MKFLRKAALILMFTASVNANATDIASNLGSLAVPSSTSYGQTHNEAINTIFWDDYTFTVTDANVDSFTASLSTGNLLGLSNLQARLYTGSTHYTGAVTSPDSTLLSAWGATANLGSGLNLETVVLAPIQLAAGTYTMQIRGAVTGLAGGSYAGVLNVTTPTVGVPEPESGAMFILGLLLMGLITTKRKTAL